MSQVVDLDYQLWEEYLSHCRAESEALGAVIHPDIKSYLIWKENMDYDQDEYEG